MKNKKGISAVVATVLIILITVAAVTIIWAAIIPMINNQLSSGTVCLDAVSQVQLSDAGYTCVNKSSGNESISLQIKHGAKYFDLADVQVLVSAKGNTVPFSLIDNSTTIVPGDMDVTKLPGSNEEKVFVINVSSMGDAKDIDKIQIAPVVAVGNTYETCGISATKTLQEC